MEKINKNDEKKFLEAEDYRLKKEFQKAIDIFKSLLKEYPKLPGNLALLKIVHE